jgi:hypothetical protein
VCVDNYRARKARRTYLGKRAWLEFPCERNRDRKLTLVEISVEVEEHWEIVAGVCDRCDRIDCELHVPRSSKSLVIFDRVAHAAYGEQAGDWVIDCSDELKQRSVAFQL